ncbi:Uncharacterised protein [Mycobacterium tuberculosis]|uniref:Uncharacterized protein n=1 Tax=Mycobacterium tuberculosis TaxID=1773 RepID=A0A916LE86_MYCTX|nr:Uncharacterised protein [Mycobacterium tuberculosis]COX31149.1 Uncharacterised protein [Mycobacterium tuberculosis]COX63518.1 Uncharacterised protein [Mycobacterium tuberculosis]COY58130.1 Uncharacterised protein [Mycobacterium tuberculosis]COZ42654.1 Uncharacterised protein [Mycobacterium tuberculosis]
MSLPTRTADTQCWPRRANTTRNSLSGMSREPGGWFSSSMTPYSNLPRDSRATTSRSGAASTFIRAATCSLTASLTTMPCSRMTAIPGCSFSQSLESVETYGRQRNSGATWRISSSA